jgi:5-methyltetrahydrofolate--homocysteine methyltransferase
LRTAREVNADVIGVSGLITPSLEEMMHIAKEMQREGFTIPLLIGGATTSRVHTAVKIAPHYKGPVIWVPDASRSVPVVSSLLSSDGRDAYVKSISEDYEKVREQHANKKGQALVSLASARKNATKLDWKKFKPTKPKLLGLGVFDDYPLDLIAQHIDWTPFFQTWDLAGKYPNILQDEIVGEAARNVFQDGQAMLARIVAEKWLKARAVIGLCPANSVGDDVEIYADDTRNKVVAKFHFLRQQAQKPSDRANYCLADFVAPKDSGAKDYFGCFAVTAGIGIDPIVAKFEKNHDDYNAIMIKALADRLAEAFAERLHLRVRKEFWGYAKKENLSNSDLIAEKYHGIRPAPGYPACPDHTEKGLLFDLLNASENAGMTLTESYAMLPTAAVSGFYFGHPDAQYFAVGKIDKDQVADYAARKHWDAPTAEKWLAPLIG